VDCRHPGAAGLRLACGNVDGPVDTGEGMLKPGPKSHVVAYRLRLPPPEASVLVRSGREIFSGTSSVRL
jgi:hypothetical protein